MIDASSRRFGSDSIGWLWLSDLHCGQHALQCLWPTLADQFFEDIRTLNKISGPWDLIIFTGDMVYSGRAEQFQTLNATLNHLKSILKELQQNVPRLLSIPGNHDLERPDRSHSAVFALRHWWEEEELREQFWDSPDSDCRRLIENSFKSFSDWQAASPFPRPQDYRTGVLPGDFSSTIMFGGTRLGIVGLNTTFLQLDGADYERKLALDPRQLSAVCPSVGPSWFSQRDFCFLLTHHPLGWLHPVAVDQFRGGIYTTNRFAAHFHGHMHTSSSIAISEGGAEARRHYQAPSLFGLERFGEAFDKDRLKFGYMAGRLEIEPRHGRLTLWPRVATKAQAGDWRLGADSTFVLEDGTEHTRPVLIDRIQTGSARTVGVTNAESTPSLSEVLAISGREEILRQRERESLARCVMRWQAAGVRQELAEELANDPTANSLPSGRLNDDTRKVTVLVGPIGSGKSLVAERFFQEAVNRALTAPDAPTPLYLDSSDVAGRLSDAVQRAIYEHGSNPSDGAMVFVQEATGGEYTNINSMLNDARVVVQSFPNTRLVLASRDIPSICHPEEIVRVPELSESQATALIDRVASIECGRFLPSWRTSVRSAIRRPLFAILLANYLKLESINFPRSKSDLLVSLVNKALDRVQIDREKADDVLEFIALQSIERGGGYIPESEVVTQDRTRQITALCDAGLVVRRSNAVAFPLAILGEWFAAQSLAKGNPATHQLIQDPERLERWFYPLAISITLGSHEVVTRIPRADR